MIIYSTKIQQNALNDYSLSDTKIVRGHTPGPPLTERRGEERKCEDKIMRLVGNKSHLPNWKSWIRPRY